MNIKKSIEDILILKSFFDSYKLATVFWRLVDYFLDNYFFMTHLQHFYRLLEKN